MSSTWFYHNIFILETYFTCLKGSWHEIISWILFVEHSLNVIYMCHSFYFGAFLHFWTSHWTLGTTSTKERNISFYLHIYIYISFILSISLNSSFYLEMAISQELGLPQMMVLLEKMFCEQDTMRDKDCNEKIIVDNICE